MTDETASETTQSEQPEQPVQQVPGETAEVSSTPAPRPAGGGGRKGLVVAGCAVGAVALIAAGTVTAVSLSSGSSDSAADVLPSTAFAYAEVDLANAGQAVPTLMKLPSVKKSLDLKSGSDLREKLVTKSCASVDWAKDVAPWLGNKAAVAEMPAARGGDPVSAVAVQVTDTDAANKGLQKLTTCATQSATWWVDDGWALIAQSSSDLSAVRKAAAKASLADDADFQKWTGQVGERGFVTAYASDKLLDDLADVVEKHAADASDSSLASLGLPSKLTDPKQIADLMRKSHTFKGGAVTVRGVGNAFEAEGAVGSSAMNGQSGTLVGSLPADTTATFGAHPAKGWMDTVLKTSGADFDKSFSAAAGYSFSDLASVYGDSFALAAGQIDLSNLANLQTGVKVEGDGAQVKAGIDKITTALGAKGMLATDTEGKISAVGMSPDYRKSLLGDGGLGKSKKFTGVVRDADKAYAVGYIDFDGLDTLVEQVAPGQADDIAALGQFGFSAYDSGGVGHTFARLTFDK
ncbi:MAG: DUF3352 domain-containing protein [Nocardioides sp.]|nr:DUF3352 domain-containing protein [Nocardioides sp.]